MRILQTINLFFAATAILTGCSGGLSQSDKQAVVAAVSCRDITSDAERLACLDNASAALAKTSIVRENAEGERTPYVFAENNAAAEDADVPAPAEKALIEPAPEADFGGERLRAREEQREQGRRQSLTSQIVEIVVNPFDKVTVTLDNGQVWRQLDGDDRTVRFPADGPQVYTAQIKQGLFGNYMMKIVERDRTIRVRRIE